MLFQFCPLCRSFYSAFHCYLDPHYYITASLILFFANLLSIGQLCNPVKSPYSPKMRLTTNTVLSSMLGSDHCQHTKPSSSANATLLILCGTLYYTPTRLLSIVGIIATPLCHSLIISQRADYYHACRGSPTISTWCDAIDAGHLTTVPTLTSAQVRKYFPQSIATYMGHLDQKRQQQY